MNKKGKMITGDRAIVTKKQHKLTIYLAPLPMIAMFCLFWLSIFSTSNQSGPIPNPYTSSAHLASNILLVLPISWRSTPIRSPNSGSPALADSSWNSFATRAIASGCVTWGHADDALLAHHTIVSSLTENAWKSGGCGRW